MSLLLIVLLVWLGLGILMVVAGLTLSRRRGPDRYLVMTTVDVEEPPADEAAEYRDAA